MTFEYTFKILTIKNRKIEKSCFLSGTKVHEIEKGFELQLNQPRGAPPTAVMVEPPIGVPPTAVIVDEPTGAPVTAVIVDDPPVGAPPA